MRDQKRPSFWGDRQAISQVVGAILVFALVATGFVIVRSTHVPAWEEQDEALHMDRMRATFAALKAESEKRVDNASSTAGSVVVQLAPTERSLWSFTEGAPGRLAFVGNGRGLSLATNEFRIHVNNGTSTYATGEEWVPIGPGETVDNIGRIAHLRIRLVDPESALQGDGATLTVYDASGTFAGDIRVYNSEHPSGYAIKVRVRDADGDVLFDQGESAFQQDRPAFYWVDALRADAQFADVLAAAKTPIRFVFAEQGIEAEYAIAYLQQGPDGSVFVGSSGVLVPAWSSSFAGGAVSYTSQNVRMPDETFVLEHGGLIVVQGDAAVVALDPAIQVQRVGELTKITMASPQWVGAGDARMERGAFPVLLSSSAHQRVEGTAPRWTVTMDTAYPAAWSAWWTMRLRDAGLSDAQGQFAVASTASAVTVTIYGTTTAQASTLHDLSIDLRRAAVSVSFGT